MSDPRTISTTLIRASTLTDTDITYIHGAWREVYNVGLGWRPSDSDTKNSHRLLDELGEQFVVLRVSADYEDYQSSATRLDRHGDQDAPSVLRIADGSCNYPDNYPTTEDDRLYVVYCNDLVRIQVAQGSQS